MTAVWDLQDLHVRFADGTDALRGATLTVRAAERVALVGTSGSGKTTLARAGFGVLPLTRGSAHILGVNVASASVRERRDLARRAQLLFQDSRAMLHPARTVRSLLLESARLHGGRLAAQGAVDTVLSQVGLLARADALPADLSGGERRRAGIARVLLARPELLVADEPTAGLDAARKADIAAMIFSQDRATVLITHDLPLALASCSRVVFFDHGAVVDSVDSQAPWAGERHPAAAALLTAAGVEAEP